MGKSKMLTLIDGNSLLFRAYYGVHSRLTRSDGTPTGAIYGFFNMILPILASANPEDSFVCVFDASRITFRQDIYAQYKMKIVDRETASREKRQLLKTYEYNLMWEQIADGFVQQRKNSEIARAEYRKNPCHENAIKIIESIEGVMWNG
jgi:5'-3' exonuclease